MALHHNPRIVTNGLTFLVDPADKNCYPGTGTTVKSLAGSVANGTLTGATFVDSYKGVFDTDGTDDYISFGSTASSLVQGVPTMSMGLFFRIETLASLRGLIGTMNYYCGGNVGISAHNSSLNFYNDTTTCISTNLSSWVEINKWLYCVATYDGVYMRIYGIKEGVLTTNNRTGKTGLTNVFASSFQIMGEHQSSHYTDGQGSLSFVYNRAITQSEVLQNYNAHCTRLGLQQI
jgi:hypothetical protein